VISASDNETHPANSHEALISLTFKFSSEASNSASNPSRTANTFSAKVPPFDDPYPSSYPLAKAKNDLI
jgi:hypothetical protein